MERPGQLSTEREARLNEFMDLKKEAIEILRQVSATWQVEHKSTLYFSVLTVQRAEFIMTRLRELMAQDGWGI